MKRNHPGGNRTVRSERRSTEHMAAGFGREPSKRKSETVRPTASRLVRREESWQVDGKLQFCFKKKKEREREWGNPVQRSVKARPFFNRFISFSTFSHSTFVGALKSRPVRHPHFTEEKNKSSDVSHDFPKVTDFESISWIMRLSHIKA